jgi:uncharacterized protein (DUF983 family)
VTTSLLVAEARRKFGLRDRLGYTYIEVEIAQARRLLVRGLKLRCPACGLGRLYRSFFHMDEDCYYCGLKFVREQGYFVGAIYINIAATEFFIFITYFVFVLTLHAADQAAYTMLFALALVLPILFNRHARSLWLSLDHLLDPPSTSLRGID